MFPSAFFKSIPGSVEPYFVTATPDGLPVAQVAPPVSQLVYANFDSETGIYTATLSPAQTSLLSKLIAKRLHVPNTPLKRLYISCKPGGLFSIGFVVDPRTMHTESIISAGTPGLNCMYQSGFELGYALDIRDSDIIWPEWVRPV